MLTRTTTRTVWPVTLEEVKQQSRVDHDDDDAILNRLISTATETVEHDTGRALIPGGWRYTQEGWPSGHRWQIRRCDGFHGSLYAVSIVLPLTPVRDVDSVAYLDEAGIEQTVDEASWTFTEVEEGGIVEFASAFSAPAIKTSVNAVRVYFNAGYDAPQQSGTGDDPALECPETARHAVLMLVGHWYENREAIADGQKYETPMAYKHLIERIRVYR